MITVPTHTFMATTTGVVLSMKSLGFSDELAIRTLRHHAIVLDWFARENNELPIKEIVDDGYGFPVAWKKDGSVNSDLEFLYGEDGTYEPLLVIHHENECLVMYEYALCAIVQPDLKHIWGRLS